MGKTLRLCFPRRERYGVSAFRIKKSTGLGSRFRPGGVWVTRAQNVHALPASNTFWFKRKSHLRLLQHHDLYHEFRYLNHTS